jgi:hypothetical protein
VNQPAPAGSIVLNVERLDAKGRKCPAGTVISGDAEGWPAHRVKLQVLHGHADVVSETEE